MTTPSAPSNAIEPIVEPSMDINDLTEEELLLNTEENIVKIIAQLMKLAPDGDAFSFVQEKFEKELLKQCLSLHKNNQVQTANYLGITRNTLRTKIEKYHLN